MPQGWAGNRMVSEGLKCAPCLVGDRSIPADTQVSGTLLCVTHAKEWAVKPNRTLTQALKGE